MPRQRLVIMSDIEMGAGGLIDDFPYSTWLGERLLAYADEVGEEPLHLVFNGDTFDFLKTAVDGTYPTRVSAQVALAKLARVQAAHPDFFAAIKAILEDTRGERRVSFLLGNHDMELAFPEVQSAMKRSLGPVEFPGFTLRIGELQIEHGMQHDGMFSVNPDEVFLLHEGEKVLALPWGATAIIDVALPLQHRLFQLDRLKPRNRVLELVPEVKDLLVNAYWDYWTRDWWSDFWGGSDPSKRISWTMIRDVAYRFGTLDTDLYVGDVYKQLVRGPDGPRVCVVGHLHQPALWTWLDRRVVYTGCLRDEWSVSADGDVDRRLPKSWAVVDMDGDRVRAIDLVETQGPPARDGQIMAHVREILARIQDLLPQPEERAAVTVGEQDQRTREAAAQAAGEPLPGPRERLGPDLSPK